MLTITVVGMPAPQGSKKGFFNPKLKRVMIVEDSSKVKPWREAVKHAALDACRMAQAGTPCISGPVHAEMVFTFPKLKSASKKVRAWKTSSPDLDKLVRSTGDALTDAGVWEDDSRMVSLSTSKLYVGDEGALHVPGASIQIASVLEAFKEIK